MLQKVSGVLILILQFVMKIKKYVDSVGGCPEIAIFFYIQNPFY